MGKVNRNLKDLDQKIERYQKDDLPDYYNTFDF